MKDCCFVCIILLNTRVTNVEEKKDIGTIFLEKNKKVEAKYIVAFKRSKQEMKSASTKKKEKGEIKIREIRKIAN